MTIFSGSLALSVQIVSAVVLARLITPRDFGLVTMVTTFSLLLSNASTNGFTDAVIQREEINHGLASSLFWVNVCIGALLALLFAASGPLVAKFYGEAAVTHIVAGISGAIFITSLSALHLALLKRSMNYTAAAANEIIGRVIGVSTAIGFAWAGWGYWSLVCGAYALAVSMTIGAWILCSWVPGRPRRLPGTGSVLQFASHISGRFTVNYFARNSDNLLIGWRFGAYSLGFYKKAYDLFALSATQLVSATSNVAVSALSRVRNDRPQYFRYLLGAIGVMAFLGMGLAGDLTLVGKDLIRVLLGPGWEPAGRTFTFFAPGIGIMIVYGIHGWIHVSIGRADRWFRWGIVEWVVTSALFLIGLAWGPEGFALAWCLSFWILTIPAMWYAGQPIGLGMGPIVSVVWRYILASLIAGLTTELILYKVVALSQAQGTRGAALRLGLVTAMFAFFYLAAIVVLHRSTEPLRILVKLFREVTSGVGFGKRSDVAAVESETGEMEVSEAR